MTKLPVNPLAAVIAAASKSLPTRTGAVDQARTRRLAPPVSIVLCDVSESMSGAAGAGRRKIDVLRDALAATPPTVRIVAFSSQPHDVRPGAPLPPPGGTTALHLALRHVAPSRPSRLLVISDGHPDDAHAALAEADALGAVRIDVIYCGPPHDHVGMAFMRQLARGGGGAHHHNLQAEPARLQRAVVGLLEGPK